MTYLLMLLCSFAFCNKKRFFVVVFEFTILSSIIYTVHIKYTITAEETIDVTDVTM